jgi:long-chain acyl-CoA synthetase
LDAQSDALASAGLVRGCERGDRVAIYLQNVPQFVIALVAAWKLGMIAVLVNPMNRERELRALLSDSGASAMNTHANIAFNAQVCRDWMSLRDGIPILGIAPLFHITGLIGNIGAAFICTAPLILACRFEPGVILDAIREYHAEFTIGSITAFIALMNHPQAAREDLASMRRIFSGGAAIPPSVAAEFHARFGLYLHNGYGLTETSAPTHCVPIGADAPVDPSSGTLAIGVPVFNVESYIGDEGGRPLPGEIGEIIARGPMVVPGYWNNQAETDKAFVDGYFRTGDVGFMDEKGWFYLVDRKKDMINAGGYKVWPREIEDVLYTHPAVREAAVVGVADTYRGETVKAVVSLRPNMTATPDELIAYCKERMAAYKYPRIVRVIEELPKTITGKILRRDLKG